MAIPAQRIQLGPFFDTSGNICGGALLYHYEAGTSTLKNIWSDSLETTTLAQPFVSDASGIFNFFADGNYKIVIKQSDGTDLYTLDNWDISDITQATFAGGPSVATASSMTLGDAVWAHWTGSTTVTALTGSAPFYWAMADGNFSLTHSSALVLPSSRNRKVLAGDVLLFINEGSSVFSLGGHMQTEGGWYGRQGASVAASSTLAVPTDGDVLDVSGTTTISAVATAAAGYRFRARFTGTGLNITHNGTSLISPWGVDYRTVANELIEFTSLGSGNWMFFSLNGPKEQPGQVISWNGTSAPLGGLAMDGSAVSRTTYSGLYAKVGTTFGVGDGSTTFNVPDDRGRVEIMIDGAANRITSASTNGANADTLGGAGGAQTHTLVTAEMPAHTHTVGSPVFNVAGAVCAAGSDKGTTATTSSSTGGDGAHSNTQPWIARHRYIRF